MVSILCLTAIIASTSASELPPWRTTAVNEINRLPARALLVPCETEELALGIARGQARTDSRWIKSLNGVWDFKWKPNPDGEWEKSAKLAVPGCWQLQGAFDPALYTNVQYPIGFDGTGDPMIEP